VAGELVTVVPKMVSTCFYNLGCAPSRRLAFATQCGLGNIAGRQVPRGWATRCRKYGYRYLGTEL
jgi:hypothetical protein